MSSLKINMAEKRNTIFGKQNVNLSKEKTIQRVTLKLIMGLGTFWKVTINELWDKDNLKTQY